jgi:transcription-repair coupling factor (superfamily II helicase)
LNAKQVLDNFCDSRNFGMLIEALRSYAYCQVVNVRGSAQAMMAAGIFQQAEKSQIAILPDKETAQFFKSDIENLIGENRTLFLPDSFTKSFYIHQQDSFNIQQRTEILNNLIKRKNPYLLITYPEALAETVVPHADLKKNRIELNIGDRLDLDFFMEFLNEYHFERVDFVYEPGQFSIRGGILDVFSFSFEFPYRIELDGHTIESIRAFDPVSQLSLKELQFSSIVPNVSREEIISQRTSIWDYFTDDSLIVAVDLPLSLDIVHHGIDKAISFFENPLINEGLIAPTLLYDPPGFIQTKIGQFRVVEIGQIVTFKPGETIDFQITAQPSFDKSFDLLITHLRQNEQSGITNLVFSETGKQIERLQSIFEDLSADIQFTPVYQGLSGGFMDGAGKMAYYTEHQIFNKYYRVKSKTRYTRNQALTLKELRDLVPGDYVVHIDHGIGKFEGLQKIEMAGTMQEAVRISYKNNDLLYVNIHSLHKISKYSGKDGTEPSLNKLGSDAWQNLKRKTKTRVKDIARDLIKLYAKRKAEKGFGFSPDSYLMTELEASFMYEDTPDQAKAIEDVKRDMETDHPMDRLVCGDVGFGKTEVAIRAAFKSTCDSKQVVVLVPTTILAQQHYRTFKERLRDFPVKVDYISRFRTAKQQKETLKQMAEGKVDIVIGTHKLLGKDIKFKDLGLLIIDEEQKFGVAAKDRIKALRVSVDTLTLTATPIPRTLHFSIMGARDLSIINTPPPNRQSVNTELHVFSQEILKSAVDYELARGGQVFVVHNRVKDIYEIAGLIEKLCPRAKVCVGHGQLGGDELEDVMLKFVEGDYDVLVATTIIESGLDISNANTMIINNAHYFGLSDLHQMRGRVGRSNKKAFCYLFAPTILSLTDEAKRRLKAIEEFSDLGSGFNVAMRDLDIRGAGNLLGGEQSGFITDIGFEMYHKILDEAIRELKQEEFSDEMEVEEIVSRDCQIETDLDIMIPDKYIRNISERLSLYNELARIDNTESLDLFSQRMMDRFGRLPQPVMDLIQSVKLKWFGKHLGFEKISLRQKSLTAWFTKDDRYFQGEQFGKILEFIRQNSSRAHLKQTKDTLTLKIQDIKSLNEGISLLKEMDVSMVLGNQI